MTPSEAAKTAGSWVTDALKAGLPPALDSFASGILNPAGDVRVLAPSPVSPTVATNAPTSTDNAPRGPVAGTPPVQPVATIAGMDWRMVAGGVVTLAVVVYLLRK